MSAADDNQAPSVADPSSRAQPPADQIVAEPSPPSRVDRVGEVAHYELSVNSCTMSSDQTAPNLQAVEQPQIVQLASVSGSRLRLNFSINPSPLDPTPTSNNEVTLDMQSETPGQYHIYLVSEPSQLAITHPTSDGAVHAKPIQEIRDPAPAPVALLKNDAQEEPPSRRKKTACECPYCRGPKAKRKRYPNGVLQHICHVNYCRRIFDRVSNLRRHLDWHRGTRSFFCQTCGKGFARRDKFREHVRRHLTIKRNSRKPVAKIKCDCPNCSNDKEHRVVDFEGKPMHLCHIAGCNKAFCYVGNLRRHLVEHRVKTIFTCKYCKKWFLRWDEFNQHLKTHQVGRGKARRPVNCNCPNCTAPGGNKTKGIDGKPAHVCYIGDCRQTFNSVGNLKRHVYLHTGEKKFVCPHCEWKFARKDKYDEHVRRVHLNQKRRQCKCPNCLSGKKVRARNGRLLHICYVSDCRKSYDQVVSLRKHLKIHNTDQLYFCKMATCPEVYLSKSGLDEHVKSAHKFQRQQIECPCANCNVKGGNQARNKDGMLIHNCPLPHCDKVFSRPSHVQRHLDSHGGEKKFVCPNCSKGYARKVSLKNHIMTHMDEPSTSKANDGKIAKNYD